MKKINSIIFDLDGVITDTAEYHYLAWKKLADEEGLEFDKELNEQLKGVSRLDSLKIMLKHNNKNINSDLMTQWATRKNNYYVDYINTITPEDLLPGIGELLGTLKSDSVKIALGSASKNAIPVLERLKIVQYFDVIGDGNSVKNSKPAPDIFLHAAEQLGESPETCIVIEDAEAGVEAAKEAGMKVVGIGTKDKMHRADFIYSCPSQIDLDKILA